MFKRKLHLKLKVWVEDLTWKIDLLLLINLVMLFVCEQL